MNATIQKLISYAAAGAAGLGFQALPLEWGGGLFWVGGLVAAAAVGYVVNNVLDSLFGA